MCPCLLQKDFQMQSSLSSKLLCQDQMPFQVYPQIAQAEENMNHKIKGKIQKSNNKEEHSFCASLQNNILHSGIMRIEFICFHHILNLSHHIVPYTRISPPSQDPSILTLSLLIYRVMLMAFSTLSQKSSSLSVSTTCSPKFLLCTQTCFNQSFQERRTIVVTDAFLQLGQTTFST